MREREITNSRIFNFKKSGLGVMASAFHQKSKRKKKKGKVVYQSLLPNSIKLRVVH